MNEIDNTIIGWGASTQSNSIDSKASVLSGYSLTTSAQTIVGAINEILPKATGVGKIDSTSNGTGEVFNAYEGENVNVASGAYSHAEGAKTNATGDASHTEGFDSDAIGNYSHAEGSKTNATGNYSHAEGNSTRAVGGSSHAEGWSTEALGSYSHAEGCGTTARNTNEHAEGAYNVSNSPSISTLVPEPGYIESVTTIHSVGIGTSDSDRKNAHEIMADGGHYVYNIGGYNGTNATDYGSKTLQRVVNDKAENFTAGTGLEMTEDRQLNVTLDTTVFYVVQMLPTTPAEGNENKICLVPTVNVSTLAPEIGTVATHNEYTEYIWVDNKWEELGKYYSEVDLTPYLKSTDAAATYLSKTDATSTYLNKTDASSTYLSKTDAVGKIDSTSDGTGEIFNSYRGAAANVAYGSASHAEGANTTASASGAHAEGYNTTASGNYSHAEGYNTTASGNDSHSEGNLSTASGSYSHAEGDHTEAFGASEHSEGKYNKSYKSTSASVRVIHSVGIGSAESDRKNAHEIKINGDHYVYGVGGYNGTNSDTAQTLQTVLSNLGPNIIEVPELSADYNIPANATNREFLYIINIGATLYSVTGDASIKWAGGVTPTASANSILVVSVLNNLATWQTFI